MLTQSRSTRAIRRAVKILDAAATPHGFDRYAELVAPTWSTNEVRGRVVGVRRQTASTVTLTIEANRNWAGFTAGQYTQLTVEIDGVRYTRCYSMANAATDATRANRTLELTVKAHPEGVVSNFLVTNAQVGMVVGLSPAAGEFTLPQAATRTDHLLLVSGGSGITPVMGMLRTLCAEGHSGPVTFVHYCLTAAEMTYGPELDALAGAHPNVRVVRIFTDEPGAGDLEGFVDPAQLDAIDPAWVAAETYLCGPAGLMGAMTRIFDAAGISERLHTEAFTLGQLVAEAGDVAGSIRFSTSERDVASDGRVILEQAEAAGLRPVHGCRMGICHTCTCPLVSGTVRNVRTGQLTAGRADGPGKEIQICINAPVGDIELNL
jgi:ferredoxin-NADP reductase